MPDLKVNMIFTVELCFPFAASPFSEMTYRVYLPGGNYARLRWSPEPADGQRPHLVRPTGLPIARGPPCAAASNLGGPHYMCL